MSTAMWARSRVDFAGDVVEPLLKPHTFQGALAGASPEFGFRSARYWTIAGPSVSTSPVSSTSVLRPVHHFELHLADMMEARGIMFEGHRGGDQLLGGPSIYGIAFNDPCTDSDARRIPALGSARYCSTKEF